MSINPGKRYQLWPQIIFLGLITWGAISFALLSTTWEWFIHPSWGPFSDHHPWITKAIWQLVSSNDTNYLKVYWQAITREELTYQLLLHLLLPLIIATIITTLLIKKLLWVDGGRERLIHIKGPRIYTGKDAIKHASKMHQKDMTADKRSKDGIHIHPKISISTSREQSNILILGTTGSGKSMVLKPILFGAISRGDYALIYDEKKEYTGAFFEESSTVLLAPWDKRGTPWNLSKDIKSKQDAILVANSMIPDSGSKDQMWVKGARLLFIGMIIILVKQKKPWGWTDLAAQLQRPQDEIQELLAKHFPIASAFVQEGSKTTQGFYVNLISELSWLDDLSKAWPKIENDGFSIRDWVTQSTDKKVIIIQSDPRYDSVGAPLCNAIISLMTRYYLALKDNTDRRTWLCIDEAANLPPNPNIKKWLELARSRGARSLIATQSLSALKENYGANNTDSILNLLSTVITLRMGAAGDEAKYASKILSSRIVERPTSAEPDSNWQRTNEPVVEEFELTQLTLAGRNGVKGYLLNPGWNSVLKLRWPLFLRTPIAEEHIPANWLSAPKNSEPNNKNRLRKRENHANHSAG